MVIETTPRLRMFAGPNGSGKSTLKALLRPELIERYVNPDEIEKEIRQIGVFDFSDWIAVEEGELREFFAQSTLLIKAGLQAQAANLRFEGNQLFFAPGEINSYFSSVIADLVRRKLVANQKSFTFETVMSSPDKIEFLRFAKQHGFRIYLYFVATDDADINVSRVANRVILGGHDVPLDKIIARYTRSLDLLADAIRIADRAYVFDNSGAQLDWLAEFENGEFTQWNDESPPRWFETYVLDKLN